MTAIDYLIMFAAVGATGCAALQPLTREQKDCIVRESRRGTEEWATKQCLGPVASWTNRPEAEKVARMAREARAAEEMRKHNEAAQAKWEQDQRDERERQLAFEHGAEWMARRKEIYDHPLDCPPGTKVEAVMGVGGTTEWCKRESDGVAHGPARKYDDQFVIVDTANHRDGQKVDAEDETIEVDPATAKVFAGTGTATDRQAGQGCTYEGERQLTLNVDDEGRLSWFGYSADDLACPGAPAGPTRCKQWGTGWFERDGKTAILHLTLTGTQGITKANTDWHLWKCGGVKVVVPSSADLGNKCVRLGLPDEDQRYAAANDFTCRESRPWEELDGKPITVQADKIVIPWNGKRARLTLKAVGR